MIFIPWFGLRYLGVRYPFTSIRYCPNIWIYGVCFITILALYQSKFCFCKFYKIFRTQSDPQACLVGIKSKVLRKKCNYCETFLTVIFIKTKKVPRVCPRINYGEPIPSESNIKDFYQILKGFSWAHKGPQIQNYQKGNQPQYIGSFVTFLRGVVPKV